MRTSRPNGEGRDRRGNGGDGQQQRLQQCVVRTEGSASRNAISDLRVGGPRDAARAEDATLVGLERRDVERDLALRALEAELMPRLAAGLDTLERVGGLVANGALLVRHRGAEGGAMGWSGSMGEESEGRGEVYVRARGGNERDKR